MNYKIIFVITVVNNWNIEQMNVKIAFFYEYVNKKIYIKVFFEYIDFKRFRIICRFRKALYNFKQTFKIWFDTLKQFFKKHDFWFFNVDQSVFCDKKTIIIIYVDDLLITNFNKQFNKNIKTTFNKQFYIIDFNFIIHYFDIKLDRNKFQRILWFSQRVYLKKNSKIMTFSIINRLLFLWKFQQSWKLFLLNISLTLISNTFINSSLNFLCTLCLIFVLISFISFLWLIDMFSISTKFIESLLNVFFVI